MLARLVRFCFGAILLALVACRGPVPGLWFLTGQLPASPGPGAPGGQSGGTVAVAADALFIEALDPDNGGPGAAIAIRGRNLAAPGTKVLFGALEVAFEAAADGSLRLRVPEGARNALVTVRRGQEEASKPFRVTDRLILNVLRVFPAAIGYPVAVDVDAFDTAGGEIASPSYDLSVEPPDAAEVVGRSAFVPRRLGSFRVQAASGQAKGFRDGTACQGDFFLERYIGDGDPYQVVDRKPVLVHGGLDGNEDGAASTAHLLRPWALINDFTLGGKKGLLFSDSGSGRLRFVPDGGGSIETVMGGGTAVPQATDSAGSVYFDPKTIELIEPAGLAVGQDIVDDATESFQDVVMVVERGRHRILAWHYKKVGPNVRVIAGTGAPTSTRQTATDSALVQAQAMGDQDKPKKVCGEPTAATFWDPAGIAVLARQVKVAGKLLYNTAEVFVADTNNHVIRRIVRKATPEVIKDFNDAGCNQSNLKARTGVITTIVGNGKPGDSIAVAEATGSSINSPLDVALDPGNGNLDAPIVFSDSNNNRILQVKGVVGLTEEGTSAYSIDSIAPPAGDELAPLGHPAGIYLQPGTGMLLIADTLKHRVLVVPANRAQMGVVGSCTVDAKPETGIVWPRAIAPVKIDGTGKDATIELFFSDFQHNEIRKLRNFRTPDDPP